MQNTDNFFTKFDNAFERAFPEQYGNVIEEGQVGNYEGEINLDYGFDNDPFKSRVRVNQLVRNNYKNKPFHKEKGFSIYTNNNTDLLFSEKEPEKVPEIDLPEVVVTASKRYRRSLMEFEDFDLFLFTSTDGAVLLKEHRNLQVGRNEIAIFLEIDNKTNFFGSVMRVKVGNGIRTNTNLPYHEIINFAHNKKIDISPRRLKKILNKGVKSKKRVFKWILSTIANVATKAVKFVTSGIGNMFFKTIPHAINHIKAKEKDWNPNVKDYKPILIPKSLENYLEKLKKTESDDFENKVINKLIKPFFNQVDQLEKKVKTQLKTIKGFVPNKIYRKIKKGVNYIFKQIKTLEEAIYSVKDAFIDLILTSLQIVNAFLCGLYNSLIDIINGLFQIIGIVFLGISGLVDFAANAGYYSALATEIIENILESIYNTNYKELFTQFLLLPFKLSKFFYNYAKKATNITPQEVFYFLGYVVGFVIETIISILLTGGTLTLNKVLVKTFKEPFELLLRGVKKIGQVSVSLFEKVLQFLQYAFKKLENVKELFLKFYKWLDQIILSGRTSNILAKGGYLYSDFTLGIFQTLKLLHKKYWIAKLNKVGLQFEETNNIIKFVYKDKEIFSGTKAQAKEELLSYFKKAGTSDKKLEKYLDEVVELVKKRKAAYLRWAEKFEKKFHLHFDGEIVPVLHNDGTVAYYKMAGAHNHEKIGDVFELTTIRKPPGVDFNNLPNDIPFKGNVEMIKDGVRYQKKATSTFFPKKWDITRVKEEIALVYEEMIRSGKTYHAKSTNRKFDFMNSEGTFKIRIEFDELGNITNAYPLIN